MNKKTQIAVVSIMGGILGLSLLAQYWLSQQAAKPALDLDGLLNNKKAKPISKVVLPKEEEPLPKTAKASPPIEKAEPKAETIPNDDFPLRYGSKGPRVSRLQVWLLRNYGWTGEVTDLLDKKTENQMKKHLKTDALDEATYNKLKLEAPIHQQKIIR